MKVVSEKERSLFTSLSVDINMKKFKKYWFAGGSRLFLQNYKWWNEKNRYNEVFAISSKLGWFFQVNHLLYIAQRWYGIRIYADCQQKLFSLKHDTGGKILQETFPGVDKFPFMRPTFRLLNFACAPDRALKKWGLKTTLYVQSRRN